MYFPFELSFRYRRPVAGLVIFNWLWMILFPALAPAVPEDVTIPKNIVKKGEERRLGLENHNEISGEMREASLPKFVSKYQPYLETGGAYYFGGKRGCLYGGNLWLPIWQNSNQLVFVDLNFFDCRGKENEGNFTLGYRTFVPQDDNIWGIYLGFSTTHDFWGNLQQQWNLGGEYWLNNWFLGSNLYLPKIKEHLVKEEQLRSETIKYYSTVLPGADLTLGYEFNDQCEIFLNGYYFYRAEIAHLPGIQATFKYNYTPAWGLLNKISLEAGIGYDKERKTVGFIGVKLGFGLTKGTKLSGIERHLIETPSYQREIRVYEAAYRDRYDLPRENREGQYGIPCFSEVSDEEQLECILGLTKDELLAHKESYKPILLRAFGCEDDVDWLAVRGQFRDLLRSNHYSNEATVRLTGIRNQLESIYGYDVKKNCDSQGSKDGVGKDAISSGHSYSPDVNRSDTGNANRLQNNRVSKHNELSVPGNCFDSTVSEDKSNATIISNNSAGITDAVGTMADPAYCRELWQKYRLIPVDSVTLKSLCPEPPQLCYCRPVGATTEVASTLFAEATEIPVKIMEDFEYLPDFQVIADVPQISPYSQNFLELAPKSNGIRYWIVNHLPLPFVPYYCELSNGYLRLSYQQYKELKQVEKRLGYDLSPYLRELNIVSPQYALDVINWISRNAVSEGYLKINHNVATKVTYTVQEAIVNLWNALMIWFCRKELNAIYGNLVI